MTRPIMAQNIFVNLLGYLISQIDDFLELLSASEVAMVCMITGCELREGADAKYLDPLRDMNRFNSWLVDTVNLGCEVRVVGKDLELLNMRISQPNKFWSKYPTGTDIELWLMALGLNGTPIWPVEPYYADRAIMSDESYWARFKETERLFIWFVDPSRYTNAPITVGIGLWDRSHFPYTPRDLVAYPGLVQTLPLDDTQESYVSNTRFLDINKMMGKKLVSPQTTDCISLRYRIPGYEQVGQLVIHNEDYASLETTSWGCDVMVSLPCYHRITGNSIRFGPI